MMVMPLTNRPMKTRAGAIPMRNNEALATVLPLVIQVTKLLNYECLIDVWLLSVRSPLPS